MIKEETLCQNTIFLFLRMWNLLERIRKLCGSLYRNKHFMMNEAFNEVNGNVFGNEIQLIFTEFYAAWETGPLFFCTVDDKAVSLC